MFQTEKQSVIAVLDDNIVVLQLVARVLRHSSVSRSRYPSWWQL
jgi:hypothetical protein